MELKLNYVNRIKSADMKINGLTVLVGPNNSGKSTIGRTLYSIVKAIANTNIASEEDNDSRLAKHVESMYSRLRGLRSLQNREELTKRFPRNSNDFIQQMRTAADPVAFMREKIAFIQSLEIVPRQKSLLMEDATNIMIFLTEKDNPSANIRTELQFLIESEFLNTFCSNGSEATAVELKSEGNSKITFEASENSVTRVSYDNSDFIEDATYIESPLYIHLVDAILRARTYRETESKMMPVLSTMVPSHIKDMAEKVMSAARHPIDKKEVKTMDVTKIIGGKFAYDMESHQIVFKEGKNRYSTINVASGIKSFGIVDLLESANFIGPNRLLIWDEPENHLHPEWQVAFAEKLVKLASEGVPVLVTTHSPYFLQAIRFYAGKERLGNYVNYYMPEADNDGLSTVVDVTNDLTGVFEKLTEPLGNIMDDHVE